MWTAKIFWLPWGASNVNGDFTPHDLGSSARGRLARAVSGRAPLEANRQVSEAPRRHATVQPGAMRVAPFPRPDAGTVREHPAIRGDAWELRTPKPQPHFYALSDAGRAGPHRRYPAAAGSGSMSSPARRPSLERSH